MITLFATMIVVHLLCDYPLQGDFLARAKNHRDPIKGTPWYTALLSHAGIQAGGVALTTHSPELAALEMVAHTIIDFGKSDGWYGFNVDQLLHIACKGMWVLMIWRGAA